MKHFLGIQDFALDALVELLEYSREKMVPCARAQTRPDFHTTPELAKVTLLFLEPSTRTLSSYREAAELLGFRVQEISGVEGTSFMKKESFADGVRTLAEEGANVMVIRSKFEGAPRFAAEIFDRMGYPVAVHNAGDGANRHPTQAMLNFLTILVKLGRLHDFRVGFLGDLRYSRTIHSDLDMLRLLIERYRDIKIVAVSAPEAALYPSQMMGLNIEESDSIESLRDCDIIMATRIQEERYPDPNELAKVMGRFTIGRRVLENVLRKDVIIMHPGPRGSEIAPDISEDPRVIMWKQMHYGIPARMALLMRSFQARKTVSIPPEAPASNLNVLVEESVEERLARRKTPDGPYRYFMPIKERGMVIDHLPLGSGDAIKRLLRDHAGLRGDEGCIHQHEGVKVAKGTPDERRKDVIVLEGQFIGSRFYGAIQFIAPEATFNVIENGTFRKIKADMPKILPPGIFRCPNAVCITNNDPEAQARFTVESMGIAATCAYCNRTFTRDELLRQP